MYVHVANKRIEPETLSYQSLSNQFDHQSYFNLNTVQHAYSEMPGTNNFDYLSILLVNIHIYSINSKLKCFKTYCILFHAQSNFSLPAT